MAMTDAEYPRSIFIDTNILIYANLAESPFHESAVAKVTSLDAAGTELWISRQILREYLAAMSRPGNLTAPLPLTDLVRDVRYFESRFRIAEDSALVTAELLDLLEQFLGGKQVHDANIVATLRVHGIPRLLTHNVRDFNRFDKVIEVVPLQA